MQSIPLKSCYGMVKRFELDESIEWKADLGRKKILQVNDRRRMEIVSILVKCSLDDHKASALACQWDIGK